MCVCVCVSLLLLGSSDLNFIFRECCCCCYFVVVVVVAAATDDANFCYRSAKTLTAGCAHTEHISHTDLYGNPVAVCF